MSNQLLERRRMMLSADSIPWDNILIQTLDSTRDGYNPAVAIILNNNNKGTLLDSPVVANGGRWYLTKTDAALITNISTWFRDVTSVTDSIKIVSNDNTLVYNFDNFDSFKYFTHISFSINSTFRNCTNLNSIIIPNISTFEQVNMQGSGNRVGKIIILADTIVKRRNSSALNFKTIEMKGKVNSNGNGDSMFYQTYDYQYAQVVRLNEITWKFDETRNTVIKFFEFRKSYCTNNQPLIVGSNQRITSDGCIIHLLGDVVNHTPTQIGASFAKFTDIYVGDGVSKTSDEATFALYSSDTNWSTYCGGGVPGDGKVDLWWNYNGEYKWYYVTNNLTNCTTSNPVEWPYITRNESYSTTIMANDGFVLSSVQVQMYEAVDDGVTPSTPTDITLTAYNPNTGEINIEHVTGNVIITAVAVI